jgi:protein MpaA
VLVGHSVEGRAIVAERFGAPDRTALLVFGAIHGDEPQSAELARAYAARLALSDGDDGVIVIDALNPDGLARHTKDNARGVDLNRNFPSRSWSSDHPPGYFPGATPLSEPETAALVALLEATQPRVVVAVHQPFACVNWDGPADALAAAMSGAAGLPARASVGYPTPGSFGSFWGIDRARPTITLELSRSPSIDELARCLDALECARLFRTRL